MTHRWLKKSPKKSVRAATHVRVAIAVRVVMVKVVARQVHAVALLVVGDVIAAPSPRSLRVQRRQDAREQDLDRREAELRAREEELRRRREQGDDDADPDGDGPRA